MQADATSKIAELMTVAEVAGFLRVSKNTVRAMSERGELSCYRVGGRRERRFARNEIEAYLASRSQSRSARGDRERGASADRVREPLSELSPTAVLNRGLMVHDWYMMPEAFSEPLVLDAIERFGVEKGDTVLDPFSGTGTTVVTAVLKGLNGVGIEVNPFLSFAAKVKLDWDVNVDLFMVTLRRILDEAYPLLEGVTPGIGLFARPQQDAHNGPRMELAEPDMPRLYRWMSPVVVKKVLLLRHVIDKLAPVRVRPHFLLALAAVLRPASNMKLAPHAFGSRVTKEDAPVYEMYREKARRMAEDIRYLASIRDSCGRGEVHQADARQADTLESDLLPADLAVTSPPYLNNLDYTMQTRMELFFLRFVSAMAELRDLRKTMVTSDAKAMYRDVPDSSEVQGVESVRRVALALKEAHKGKNWGWDYSFMTTQYFGGMLRALRAVKRMLKRRARLAVVVGESAHSGIKIPVPDIIAELGERVGYACEEVAIIRRRRSSSHAYELCESQVLLRRK